MGFNLFILALGLIHGVFHYEQWLDFLIGFLCVSVFLLILYYVTGGRAIGGGDVKLMGACGFVLGVWPGLIQTVLSLSLAVLAGLVECRLQKQPLSAVRLPLAPFFCFGGVSAYWLTAFALQI